MEPKRDDGGPAFPQPEINGDPVNSWARGCGGLSVRDWFAGQALAGMNKTDKRLAWEIADDDGTDMPDECAKMAYQLADAMLKERSE